MNSEEASCPNCGADRRGRFCPSCGQNDRNYTRSLWRLIGDLIKDTFEVDGRLPRTLGAMFLRPGQLAVEFSRNRRASYVSPTRAYLFASILFFFLLAVTAAPKPQPDAPPDPLGQQAPRAQEAREEGKTPAEALAKRRQDAQAACAKVDAQRIQPALDARQRRMMGEILEREGPRLLNSKLMLCVLLHAVAGGDVRMSDKAKIRIFGWDARQGRDNVPASDRAPASRNGGKDAAADAPAVAAGTNESVPVGMIEALIVGNAVEVLHDPRAAASGLLDNLPLAMFVTLPAYALLLKVFFFGSRRYYTEHLVFAMHLHTFSFLVYTVLLLMPEADDPPGILDQALEWVGLALLLWVMAYSYLALRRYYRNGRFVSACKWLVLGGCYTVLLIPGLLLSAAATLFFL